MAKSNPATTYYIAIAYQMTISKTFLLFFLASVSAWSSANDSELLDRLVQETLDQTRGRGAAFAIRIGESEIYSATFGRGFKNNEPVILASLTKPVTAYILLQMQQEGLLSVDEPIGAYVPEIRNLRNGNRIIDRPLLDFMTHNSSIPYHEYLVVESSSWRDRLNGALRRKPTESRAYSNENFVLLTRVVENVLGSYEDALERYVNVDGVTTFRVASSSVDPSYVGAGDLEASASDYLKFMERAAPLSEIQSDGFGIAWFHGNGGYRYHQGMIAGINDAYAVAMWNVTSASGAQFSFVFFSDAFDNDAVIIRKLLTEL